MDIGDGRFAGVRIYRTYGALKHYTHLKPMATAVQ